MIIPLKVKADWNRVNTMVISAEEIEKRLKEAIPDAQVEVFDLTGGGDYWEVTVTSSSFQGQSRLQQHQRVQSVFREELRTGVIHALSIKTRTR